MEPSFAGFVLDPSKCSKLTMEEKRELVYQISKCSESAPKMLQSWSRRELLQILCAEMGKERKYTGLTKIKMIEYLLKVMSKRNLSNQTSDAESMQLLPPNCQASSKRQRKTDHPVRVVIPSNNHGNEHGNLDNLVYCQNVACRAALKSGAMFCKRCSCCICYKYDDNKDPSLWLVCASEPPNERDSCGMSCHLECALKNERAGIMEGGPYPRLDGSFYCVSCQKVNDLLGCWRKQLMIAKDTRRVDTLCYRIFLSHRLLSGSEKYIHLHEIVDSVSKRLEPEVGALDGLPVKKARGIVNRLSCGPEIKKLCASAMEMLDSMLSDSSQPILADKIEDTRVLPPCMISFRDVSSSSLTIVLSSKGEDSLSNELITYSVWHRNSENADYPVEPTCTLLEQNSQFQLMDLSPGTGYVFKVVSFSNERELEKWESRVTTADVMKTSPNPSSDGDESDETGYGDLNNSPQSTSDYKSGIPSMTKLAEYTCQDINHMMDRSEHSDPEAPGDSVSALDEEGVIGAPESAPTWTVQTDSHRDSTNSSDENQASNIPKSKNLNHPESQLLEEMSIDNESNANQLKKMILGPSDSTLPVTPCKQEKSKDGPARNGEEWATEPEKEPQAGSSSKKRRAVRCEENCAQDGSLEPDYEYCVKVIRWLECEGHMEKSFRVKFLTWFSLRATPQERRIVSVYVDTLIDDPASLAGQLVDTFLEGVCRKRTPAAPTGFCLKLWH